MRGKTTIHTPIEQSEGKLSIVEGLTALVVNEKCTAYEAFQIMSHLKGEIFHALCDLQKEEA